MKQSFLLALTGLILSAGLLIPSLTHALPTFARQHKTECGTCHTIYPQLNEFGEAFRRNSYLYMRTGGVGMAAKNKVADENMDATKLLERLVQAGIPAYLPVSADATVNLVYNRHAADNNDVELALRAIRLHAGGVLRDSVGYFLTYRLYSEGVFVGNGTVPANNQPDLEEAFIIWRHALGSSLNLKAGRLQPGTSLWKVSNNPIITNFASHSYRAGLGASRSPFSLDATENGLEVNSLLGSRVVVAAGIVDRKGQKADDGYGSIAVKFGGTDLLGNEPELDLKSSETFWDFFHVTIGGFGYFGRNGNLDNNGIVIDANDFYRVGGDLDAQYKQLNLRVTGTYGRDNNLGIFGVAPSAKQEIKTYAIGAELQYFFAENLLGLLRYEEFDDGTAKTQRYLPALVYAPLLNLKLTAQYMHDRIRPDGAADERNNIALLSARLAF